MKRTQLVPRIALFASLMMLMASAGSANPIVPGSTQSQPILITGGDLYTVSQGVLANTDLLFENGKITRIGRDLPAPAGARTIDASGKRVYPGLILPGTTIGIVEISAVRATTDYTEVGSLTPEVATHSAYNPDSEVIPTVRSNGVTTAQVMPFGSLIRGRSMITHFDGWTKEDAAVKLVDGLHLAWPRATISTAWWVRDSPEEQKKKMAEERKKLRAMFDDARAYMKAKNAGEPVETNLSWEAMIPALEGQQSVYIEAGDYRQITEAVSFAAEYGLRMVLIGGRDAWLAAALLKENDIPVIIRSIMALPTRDDEDYDIVYRLPTLLHDAGVRFCIGRSGSAGDSWDGRNLPFEGGMAAAFGLSKDEALRSITLSTAEILGIADREGSLDVGKDATLFISEGDVMDVIGNRVTHMWIQGREVDLDNRHKALYRKYDRKPGNTR